MHDGGDSTENVMWEKREFCVSVHSTEGKVINKVAFINVLSLQQLGIPAAGIQPAAGIKNLTV